ncbi:hypothetical protein ACQPZF_10425 [Actinosynnema sp. CS-041913]|uniref:hypothetical protein n=1 Tax=Actinosynnema sp. CS-041913 TaxID=3239917 RepID=UPI003D8F6754
MGSITNGPSVLVDSITEVWPSIAVRIGAGKPGRSVRIPRSSAVADGGPDSIAALSQTAASTP